MKKQSREQLEQKISELETKIKVVSDNFDLKETEHKNELVNIDSSWKQKEEITKQSNTTEVDGLKTQIKSLEVEKKDKQAQLDQKELKKLASAYKEQEDIYSNEALFWLKWLSGVVVALVVSTAISISLSYDKPWYDKFEYYVVDLILISAIWFCSSQYSNLKKLTSDYANRKTIAQSFHNILNNLAEDVAIKNKFIEKATDVLCAPSFSTDKESVLSKKLLKDTVEIVKAVKG